MGTSKPATGGADRGGLRRAPRRAGDGSATTLVGGVWKDPGPRCTVLAPADRQVVGEIGYGDAALARSAADAAEAALPDWAATPGRDRADILLRAAAALAGGAEETGALLARESGKRLPEAVGEVRFAAEYFRWFAEQARRPKGRLLATEQPDRRAFTLRRPAGVVASLTPWNFPVSIQARKLAPALAAGCTVVARTSEKAPLAVVELVRLLHAAGLPDGVVNLVHGPAAEQTVALLDHPAVRVVSFTGSTEVGRRVMESASRRIVRPLLELGGAAPFLVFDDADLDVAVEAAMTAKFRNNGQSCIAANRFLVHARVCREFTSRLVERVDAMTVGDGLAEPLPDLGPLIDDDRVRGVGRLVQHATAAGAERLTRDFALPENGHYVAPALFAGVPEEAALVREEVFGPVAAITPFEDEAEALERAGGGEAGLAAYVHTRDGARIWRMAEQLPAGVLGVNTGLPSSVHAPMGGVRQSGLGREGAEAGLEEFEETHYVCQGV